jgi:AraC-like DNA-binding protein
MLRLARHLRFDTEDVEEFFASAARLLGRQIDLLKGHEKFHFTVHTAKLELLTINAVEVTDGLSIDLVTADYSLARVERGGIERRADNREHLFTAGSGYLAMPGQHAANKLPRWVGTTSSVTIALPAAIVKREAELLIGEPVHQPLEIIGSMGLWPSTYLGQRIDYLLDELERDGGVFEKYPLLGQEFQRKLVGALIEQTQNNYLPLLGHHFGGPARRHVAMMEEYIEAHIRQPITVGDLARATGVGARTLREACHRIRDMTPEMIVRRMRLHCAHNRLENPQPHDTVISIAHECGFSNAGRFADHYQREFHGETPFETIQRSRRRFIIAPGAAPEGDR